MFNNYKKIKTMTIYTFDKTLSSFQKGEMGFCTIASILTPNTHINNIGFWFEVIDNKQQPVLLVQMDSFTINKPLQSIVVTGNEQVQFYMQHAQLWAEKELEAFFTLQEPKYKCIQLENTTEQSA